MVTEQKPLHKIFTAVPDRYDLINRIFTWGQDAKWRRKTAGLCLVNHPVKILDLCCGTGDLSIDLAKNAPATSSVTGLDYSPQMLEKAKAKAARAELTTP